MTMNQQTPIKNTGKAVDIELGSSYANQLGLTGIIEYDGSTDPNPSDSVENQSNQAEKSGKKKKKNNKKKKKKK